MRSHLDDLLIVVFFFYHMFTFFFLRRTNTLKLDYDRHQMGHGDTAHDLDCSPCASETRKPAQGTCSFFLRASPSQSSTVLDNGIIF